MNESIDESSWRSLEAQDVSIFSPSERWKYRFCEIQESLVLGDEKRQRELKEISRFLEKVQIEKELEWIWR